jgi:hypothetical protein
MQYYACTRCSRAASPLVTAYAGHYILVHGYDKETREILFNDPSADSRASKVANGPVCVQLSRETHDPPSHTFLTLSPPPTPPTRSLLRNGHRGL